MRTTKAEPRTVRASGPPTPKQLRALRVLADLTGTTFTPPKSVREASVQIAAMQARRRDSGRDRRREREDVSRTLGNRAGDAARVRDAELRGYGSNASWRGA